MKTVNLFTNRALWNCPECFHDNSTATECVELDLNDPDNEHIREQLEDDGFLDEFDDEDDEDEEEDGDDEFSDDGGKLIATMWFYPKVVQCVRCDEKFQSRPMTVEESDRVNRLYGDDYDAAEDD